MKNYYFEVGERFKCDVSNDVVEVADIIHANDRMYIEFKNVENGKTSQVEFRTAQELLITKI